MSNPLALIKLAMFAMIPFFAGTVYALTEDAALAAIVTFVLVLGDTIALKIIAKKLEQASSGGCGSCGSGESSCGSAKQ